MIAQGTRRSRQVSFADRPCGSSARRPFSLVMRPARTSSASDCSIVLMPSPGPPRAASGAGVVALAHQRPHGVGGDHHLHGGPTRDAVGAGDKLRAITASRASDICWRIAAGWPPGRNRGCAPRPAPRRWCAAWKAPGGGSAAESAVAMVSASRISPTRITSGVCRMMLRRVPREIGRVAAHLDLLDHEARLAC